MAGTITNYNPNTLQQLRDWYERVAPKNQGQRTLFDISTGPIGALANLTTATEQDNKLAQILGLADILPAGKSLGLAAGAGLAGITKGQKLFRGSITDSPFPNPKISRRFDNPESEMGVHVTTDKDVAKSFADPSWNMFHGNEGYPHLYEMSSNVDKPLKMMDTGGSWQPDSTIEGILGAVSTTRARKNKINEGYLPFEELPKALQENLTKRNLVWPGAIYQKETGDMHLAGHSVDADFSEQALAEMRALSEEYKKAIGLDFSTGGNQRSFDRIKNEYAKKLQNMIKAGGYDHISYINTVETNPTTNMPSESAILFHPESVSMAPVEHIEYADPFKDTTK